MDMNKNTEITLAWELYQAGLTKSAIAQDLEHDRETIRIWLAGIKTYGLKEYLSLYEYAKRGERPGRQLPQTVKEWIWKIREREMDCCGQKINYFLKQEHGRSVSIPKIYEVLAEKYVIRSKWKKNKARGLVPHATKSREVIQMDSVDFGDVFAFTGVDIYTREVDILLSSELTSQRGYEFLDQSMTRRFDHHTQLLQTDGGPEFKDVFKSHVMEYCDRHRIARPYKKNEQSYIESFNRTLRKECLGWAKYRADQLPELKAVVEAFLVRYHTHRPHLSLNLQTPNQAKESDWRIFTEN
jgi:hypothetical protein